MRLCSRLGSSQNQAKNPRFFTITSKAAPLCGCFAGDPEKVWRVSSSESGWPQGAVFPSVLPRNQSPPPSEASCTGPGRGLVIPEVAGWEAGGAHHLGSAHPPCKTDRQCWAGPALSVAAQSSGQLLCGLKMIAMFSLYFSSCENEGKILVASGCKSSVVHS